MKTPLNFRPFSANDWAYFSGAQNFARTIPAPAEDPLVEPLITEIAVGLETAMIVVDPTGVEIVWVESESGEDHTVRFSGPNALRALALLGAETTRGALLALGGIES